MTTINLLTYDEHMLQILSMEIELIYILHIISIVCSILNCGFYYIKLQTQEDGMNNHNSENVTV